MVDAPLLYSGPKNRAEVEQLVANHHIETVLVGGADVNGIFRGKRIPAWRFVQDPEAAMHFAEVVCVFDWVDDILPPRVGHAGWWPSWDTGFGDIEGVPLLDTLRPVPWLAGTAVVLCDFNDIHGQPLEAMPRQVLRRMVDRFQAAGYTPIMTPEYEFTVLAETHETLDAKGFRDPAMLVALPCTYGVDVASRFEPLIAMLRRAIEGLGIPVEASNAEGGPGQFEVNLTPSEALMAGDHAMLFKHAVKQVTALNGHVASFMAKLAPGGFGSSCHVHQSLQGSDGSNVFYDGTDDHRLSQVAKHYVAGLVATMREFTAVFAPTINSFKRFEPEAAVGSTVTWAVQSKAVGIRVVNESSAGCRVEHRAPGADVNPYLALAAMLAGGLWGIEKQLELPDAYRGNSYTDPEVEWLPRTMAEAVPLFEDSEVANEYFGEEAVRFFAGTRRYEMERFNNTVTDWEVRRYLTTA